MAAKAADAVSTPPANMDMGSVALLTVVFRLDSPDSTDVTDLVKSESLPEKIMDTVFSRSAMLVP
jgi:hypothetical protein